MFKCVWICIIIFICMYDYRKMMGFFFTAGAQTERGCNTGQVIKGGFFYIYFLLLYSILYQILEHDFGDLSCVRLSSTS